MESINFTHKNRKTARKNIIGAVFFVQLAGGYLRLTPRSTRLLAFFVALVRMGYDALDVTCDELGAAFSKATNQPASRRTLYRSMAELETAGYITRERERIGACHFRRTIIFNLPALSFWTKVQASRGSCVPKRHKAQGMKNSCSKTNIYIKCKDRVNNDRAFGPTGKTGGAGALKMPHRTPPVLYTLSILLTRPGDREAYRIAYNEFKTGKPGTRTGIDWPSWEKSWLKMSIDEREGQARCNLLPALRASSVHKGHRAASSSRGATMPAGTSRNENRPPSREDRETVRSMIRGFLDEQKKRSKGFD